MFLGTFIIYHAVRDTYEGNASQNWPTIQGRIVSFLVKEELGHNIVPSYSVNVTYRYAVDGKLESSDRMTVGGNEAGDRSEAQSIVSEYPAGSDVTVHYSPTEPSRSVLKAGTDRGFFFIIGGCGLALIWSAFFL